MEEMPKLGIDPGHGSSNIRPGVYDPGAVSGSHSEAAYVLQLGLTGKWVLNNAGIAVYMTRDDDSDVTPISTRDDKAEAAGCTHFISLHMNAASLTATGTETFYRDSTDKAWAQIVQDAALEAFGLRDRGLKHESETRHGRLAVLGFDGPACLLEAGFITNMGDRNRINERERRIKFWTIIAEALI